jgi:isoaspartyl peptidase/L-asparaginase-like protein (Ntn-hydrolase superfamily)
VACTGHGEEIIRGAVARSVYDEMARGTSPKQALEHAARAFPVGSDIGIIAIDGQAWAVVANRSMPFGRARAPKE